MFRPGRIAEGGRSAQTGEMTFPRRRRELVSSAVPHYSEDAPKGFSGSFIACVTHTPLQLPNAQLVKSFQYKILSFV